MITDPTIYVWQVEPMPFDPLYNTLKVELDFQLAIDRKQVDFFVEKLQCMNTETSLRLQCTQLPSGQPHSCDDYREIWGIPSKIYKSLLIKKNAAELNKSWVEENSLELVLNLQEIDLINFIVTINKARRAKVFFEYDYFVELSKKSGEIVKLNFWGWCENGSIEYAN